MHTLSSVSPTLASWLRMVHRDPERRGREVFLSTTEIGSTFFQCVSTVWRVIINEKNGRSLSLSLSPYPLHQYFPISDLGREIETHDARPLIVPLLVSLHPSYLRGKRSPPSSPLCEGGRGEGEMVSFARGEKEGRGKSRSRLALLATPLSFRMKKSGWNIEPPPLLCERGVSIRPEVIPIFLAITWRASDRIRREERSWNWNFVDS